MVVQFGRVADTDTDTDADISVGGGECVLVFIHFLARRERGEISVERKTWTQVFHRIIGDIILAHRLLPLRFPVSVPHRQTLIDVIFTLDTRLSFCNLLRSVSASFPLNLISVRSHLPDTFAVDKAAPRPQRVSHGYHIIHHIRFIRYIVWEGVFLYLLSKQFRSADYCNIVPLLICLIFRNILLYI